MADLQMAVGEQVHAVQDVEDVINETDVITARVKNTIIIPARSSSSSSNSYRPMTRSQARGGKPGADPDKLHNSPSPPSLKRTVDKRAEDEDTDVELEHDAVSSKHPKLAVAITSSMSSSTTKVDDQDVPEIPQDTKTEGSPTPGNFTFLDTSASSFTSERRGPRIRTAPPVPVPNLTKKSRGRRVPTKLAAEEGDTETKQKAGRVYVCKVEGCGKCFSRGEHLKRHIRSIHTHEKPFKCTHPMCDKRFNRHDNLLQHLRVHKGESSSQTSTETDPPRARTAAPPAGASTPVSTSDRSTPIQSARSSRRTTAHPSRSSHASTAIPPIATLPPPRASSSRPPPRSMNIVVPRTYSYPSSPTLTTHYRSPTAACFMNNTNIAVSSLRTSMEDDADEGNGTDHYSHDDLQTSHSNRSMTKADWAYQSRDVSSDEEDSMGNTAVAKWNTADGPSSSPSDDESEAVSAFAKLREGRQEARASGSGDLTRSQRRHNVSSEDELEDDRSESEAGDVGDNWNDTAVSTVENAKYTSIGDETEAVSAFVKLREGRREIRAYDRQAEEYHTGRPFLGYHNMRGAVYDEGTGFDYPLPARGKEDNKGKNVARRMPDKVKSTQSGSGWQTIPAFDKVWGNVNNEGNFTGSSGRTYHTREVYSDDEPDLTYHAPEIRKEDNRRKGSIENDASAYWRTGGSRSPSSDNGSQVDLAPPRGRNLERDDYIRGRQGWVADAPRCIPKPNNIGENIPRKTNPSLQTAKEFFLRERDDSEGDDDNNDVPSKVKPNSNAGGLKSIPPQSNRLQDERSVLARPGLVYDVRRSPIDEPDGIDHYIPSKVDTNDVKKFVVRGKEDNEVANRSGEEPFNGDEHTSPKSCNIIGNGKSTSSDDESEAVSAFVKLRKGSPDEYPYSPASFSFGQRR